MRGELCSMSDMPVPHGTVASPPTDEELALYHRYGRGDAYPWARCPMCGRRVAVVPTGKFVRHGSLEQLNVRRRPRART